MRTVEELNKEVLSDLQCEAEQKAKSEIKSAIQAIISEQKRIAESAERISKLQASLKAIQVEVISVAL
jgi:hypothetical protein